MKSENIFSTHSFLSLPTTKKNYIMAREAHETRSL